MKERLLLTLVLLLLPGLLHAFRAPSFAPSHLLQRRPRPTEDFASSSSTLIILQAKRSKGDESEADEDYRNAATKVLSNFMSSPKDAKGEGDDPFRDIDWDAPKIARVPLEKLARALDAELYEKEWFVTGRVNPRYFADSFRFQDPDVQVTGIQKYAEGVRKIFNQETARAEIISTGVSGDKPNTITCTWRLSGKVDIGPGLTIKPYIVYTDFTVDEETGLVVFQEDRFDLPGWDILLSSFFPFLIGKLTADPAPEPEPRNPPPKIPAGVLTSTKGNKTSMSLFPWLK